MAISTHHNQAGFIPGSKDGSISAYQPMWYTTLTKQRIKITWSSQ